MVRSCVQVGDTFRREEFVASGFTALPSLAECGHTLNEVLTQHLSEGVVPGRLLISHNVQCHKEDDECNGDASLKSMEH